MKSNQIAQNQYIIALTANASSEDEQMCMSAGIRQLYIKTNSPDELETALRKFQCKKTHDPSYIS